MAARPWRTNLPKQLQASYPLRQKKHPGTKSKLPQKNTARQSRNQIVLVLVLEKGGVVTACIRPAPGGEPLWRVFRRPREFVLSRARPKRAAAGGSRERPSGWQLYGVDLNESTAAVS